MKKTLLGISLMICFILSTSFLVSSNSSFSGPPKPAPQRQGDSPLRSIYDNKDTFDQLSGAARSRLEMMFGKKNPKAEDSGGGTKTVTRGNKTPVSEPTILPSPIYTADDPIQPLAAPVTLSVNNPAADATARNTQSETSIALAANGNVIVSWNDSGSLQDPNFGTPNDKFTGVGVSTNGGSSFTDLGTFPTTNTALQGDSGDPLIAVDRTSGSVYVATLAFTNSGIQIFKSTNNGLTYGQPTNAFPGFSNADFFDKEWVTVDNAAGTGNGNVYVVSRLFSGSANISGIYFSRSTDQGATFSVPVGTPNIVTGQQGAYVTTGPDHSVYVFWYDSSAGRRIRMRKSTDLGLTFGATINVSPALNGTGVNGDLALTGGFRSNSFPQAVVSQVNGNILYATYNDINVGGTDRGDVFVVASTDAGATWGTPTKINDDNIVGAQQYSPVIALTPDGTKLFSGFYDRRRTGNTGIDVFGAIQTANTTTGALTPLGGNFRITEQSFPVVVGVDPVINSTYMGDYDQAVADNSFFYLSYGDNRTGNPDVRFSKISTAGPGALLDFSTLAIVADGNSSGTIDINESASLNVTLRNSGTSTATGITATLSTTTPGVTVTTANASYPNIAPSMTGTNATPFVIMTSPTFQCGTMIQLSLNVSTTSDGTFIIPFTVGSGSVGTPMPFESANVPVTITDVSTVTSVTNVSGLTGTVGKVTVSFFLTHTFDADLDIFLIGPDGTTVELTTDNGGAGDNFGTSCAARTVFDDAAATSITAGTAPFVGTFRPEGLLSGFNGKPANGTWTLRITDDLGGDTGILMCWGLQISPLTCAGVAAPVLDRANIIVADSANSRLQASTNNGTSWTRVGTQVFNNPQGVATDNAGSLIFVAETGASRILRSTNNGTSFTVIANAGVAPGTVNAPQGLAYDQTNNKLYVADTGNNRIQVLNNASTATTGMTVFAGATAGPAVGQFNQPTGIAVNATGLVYVCDTLNNRIQFNTTGAAGGWRVFAGATAGTTLGKVNGPRGIYVNTAGMVFVADTLNNRILRNTGGSDTVTGTWTQLINPGAALGTVNAPQGVVFTSGSFIFVSDAGNRIQRFNSTGGTPFLSGPAGVAVGQFNRPTGIR